MRFKLDENLSRHLVETLKEVGHDAETAADEGLAGSTDEVLGAAAAKEGRLLLSLDVGFADLRRFPPGSHSGIVVFRPGGLGPVATNRLVSAFVHEEAIANLVGCTCVVEPGRIRIRRPAES